jgi:hypothetical protein
MTFAEFIDKHYHPEPGRAVPLLSIIRAFYSVASVEDQFDWPPAAIKKFLQTRHPVGNLYHETFVGNLTGDDARIVAERDLVVFGGDLLPRDLHAEEFRLYRAHKSDATTLTRNQVEVRGWNKRTLSRAQQLQTD